MNIKQLTQNRAVLEKVICYRYDDAKSGSISALTLQFEGGEQLDLSVDEDTDELAWDIPTRKKMKSLKAEHFVPLLAYAYGLRLTWSWEMRNHQGYLDAVQLELTDAALKQALIIQFKVAASNIEIYELRPLFLETID